MQQQRLLMGLKDTEVMAVHKMCFSTDLHHHQVVNGPTANGSSADVIREWHCISVCES
jgi:hypothetical protein